MRHIIIDLEATCWRDRRERDAMEIIEIGAVELREATGPAVREFASFVRPVASPELSDFCMSLTSIRQGDVDSADTFPAVFARFLDWIGAEPFVLASWGRYDLNQLETDCRRHKLSLPDTFRNHVNVKEEFARHHNLRPMGMAEALKVAKIPLMGTHHRGIDDARNIARLAMLVSSLSGTR